jgi:uncharacterized phage protein (TIGR02218 family)
MRVVNDELALQLQNQSKTLCNAWRLTRSDGFVLGFTDHDHSLNFDGTQFLPNSGFLPSAARSELGLNVDESDVVGAFTHDAVTEKDLRDGRYDGAQVEVFLVDWRAPDTAIKLRTQEIGEVSFSDYQFRAELRSIAHKLNQPQGRGYCTKCTADLGDEACGFDLSNPVYQASGNILSSVDEQTSIVAGLDEFEAGWFRFGLVNWTSGENIGLSVEVYDHQYSDGEVKLKFFAPVPNIPQIGDTFSITAGCAKTFSICKEKFSNTLNFQGFPHMPGRDFAYGYADEETVHDGRPLVN